MDDTAAKAAPHWMLASLERNWAEIAEGQTVSLDPVLDRLRTGIMRMPTKADQERPHLSREAIFKSIGFQQ